MIRAPRHVLVCLLGVLLVILMTTTPALGAPAYKVTIRGPGLTDAVVVWLVSDEQLLRTFNSDLSSDVVVTAPPPTVPVYEITWFFGPCWQKATPCTSDPVEVTTHRTRYAFDTDRQHGALAHLDTPAWFSHPPKDSATWYRTSTTFDRALQQILARNGVGAALPVSGSVPDGERSLIMAAIAAIISGALVLWWHARCSLCGYTV